MKISVDEVVGGWIVVGGTTMGPFPNKRRAIELAEGMASVLETYGERVELFVDGASAPVANATNYEQRHSAA